MTFTPPAPLAGQPVKSADIRLLGTQYDEVFATLLGADGKISPTFLSGTAFPTRALRGVNEAGYDFVNSTNPGVDNTTAPSNASILFAARAGATIIRLPFLHEYMQKTPLGALDPTFLAKYVATVKYARSLGLVVVVDLHSYCRYTLNGKTLVLGDGTYTVAYLTDVWTRLCKVDGIGNDMGVHLGLMNEPHDLPAQAGTLGTELFTNTGFETNAAGWTAGNAATLSRSTAQFKTGAASLAITAGSNNQPQAVSAQFTYTQGQDFVVTYSSRAAATPRQVFALANFVGDVVQADGTVKHNQYITTGVFNSSFVTNTTTGWTTLTLSSAELDIPDNVTGFNVAFAVNNAAAGEVQYVDDVSCKPSTGGKTGAQVWEDAVQQLVDAIRGGGWNNRIYWSGYNFSAAATFWDQHPTFIPNDPLNNTVPEAHYYADGAGSGTLSYDGTIEYAENEKGATATATWDALIVNTFKDLTSFLGGARDRGLEAYIGEIGSFNSVTPITQGTVSADELTKWDAWLEFCYQLFDAFDAHVTYWAAGDEFASFNYAYSPYLGVPNKTKTNVSAVIERHISHAGYINSLRLAA